MIENVWNESEDLTSVGVQMPDDFLSDAKEDIFDLDDPESDGVELYQDTFPNDAADDVSDVLLQRLPSGKSMKRLADDYFRQIHDSASRTRETYFNLRGAVRTSQNPDKFAEEWISKSRILETVLEKLSEVESLTMLAAGASGKSFPIVSNLVRVRAANKAGSYAQREQRPQDFRKQQGKRKREHEAARRCLDTLQTPLVEAHRPNKKRKSEASRHQKNYQRAAMKTRVPRELHPSMALNMDKEKTKTI